MLSHYYTLMLTDTTLHPPHLTEHGLLWHAAALEHQLTSGGGADAQLVLLSSETDMKIE